MENNTNDQLLQFIREETGEFKMEINSLTQIEDDLGVTGDEAIKLIQNISKRFTIDISEFDFKKYFHPEPNFPTTYGKLKPLLIQDIQTSIETGKLT